MSHLPSGQNRRKSSAVCKSAFLTTWHCILSVELTHSFRLFFGDFAHRIGEVNCCPT